MGLKTGVRRAVVAISLGVFSAATLGGCATRASLQPVVGPPTAGMVERVDAEQVEDARHRRAIPAHDVTIEATLWDGALVAAALWRAQVRGDDPEAVDRLAAQWLDKVGLKHTAFTVVIELGNRPAPGSDPDARPDPLADPTAWSFALSRDEDDRLAPTSVTLQGIDRFPTQAGGHHLRLAFEVVFAGSPIPASATTRSKLSLWVRTDRPQAGLQRRELGSRVAKRGAPLAWWIAPAA